MFDFRSVAIELRVSTLRPARRGSSVGPRSVPSSNTTKKRGASCCEGFVYTSRCKQLCNGARVNEGGCTHYLQVNTVE